MGIVLPSGFSVLISMGVSPKYKVFIYSTFSFFFLLGITEQLSDMEENIKETKNTSLIALGHIGKIEELVCGLSV